MRPPFSRCPNPFVIRSVAKDLCNLRAVRRCRRSAEVLRPAKDADLRMTTGLEREIGAETAIRIAGIMIRLFLLALALLVLFLATSAAAVGTDSPAPTPPMGWNSWDSYGTTVREKQVKANADWMAEHLAKYGWQYIVVDIQWYEIGRAHV